MCICVNSCELTAHRQADRQAGRQAGKQTYMNIHWYTPICIHRGPNMWYSSILFEIVFPSTPVLLASCCPRKKLFALHMFYESMKVSE